MSSLQTLLLIGSGPGIGSSVATVFASKGFNHVVLISRNYARLQDDKVTILANIKGEAPQIDLIQADISDNGSLKQALKAVDGLGSNIGCVFFNAARVAPSPLLEFPVEGIANDFKVGPCSLPGRRTGHANSLRQQP
jgi:NAD(P)-dependent dehydrogenase (short-subunit alcohol dehydrogenase family)